MAVAIALGVLGILAAGVRHLRRHPSPLPYGQRLLVQGHHPFLGRRRLRRVLRPRPDERVLEVGPGTGYHSLPVAAWIAPGGRLEIVDVVQEWLDHTVRAARERGIGGIFPTRADATALPHDDATFDAAFLVQVLGEVPDQVAALRELRRVVKPEGRLVVGESVLDPHFVTRRSLRRRAAEAGLRLDETEGGALAYVALLRPAAEATQPRA